MPEPYPLFKAKGTHRHLKVLPRARCAVVNIRNTGVAAGAIIPTIITAHITIARTTSRVRQDDMSITMPMSAIMRSCSIIADISPATSRR